MEYKFNEEKNKKINKTKINRRNPRALTKFQLKIHLQW